MSDGHPFRPGCFAGKTVVVTGASSGIGRETAILLSELGAKVVLVGRSLQKLSETSAAMSGTGHLIEPFDFSADADVNGWLKQVAEKAGAVDGLVHAAGIFAGIPLRVLETQEITKVLDVNVKSAVLLAKAFRQPKVHCNSSAIVFISSVMGLIGQPGVSAYAASKGAIISFTKSCALELLRDGIRVNCVAPGFVATEMTKQWQSSLTDEMCRKISERHPMGVGNPLDVACACVYLLSPAARWITGTTMVVDGGYTAT